MFAATSARPYVPGSVRRRRLTPYGIRLGDCRQKEGKLSAELRTFLHVNLECSPLARRHTFSEEAYFAEGESQGGPGQHQSSYYPLDDVPHGLGAFDVD